MLAICTKCSSSPPIEYGCIHPITWPPEPEVASKPEPEEPKDYGFGTRIREAIEILKGMFGRKKKA